ncbi:MAG: hypothetical protein PF495_05465 [Spirochaetales bacterium]|jgi:hypothetical protein|nr:hypothetical protein [Spirochaetales bacterium]
MTTKLNQDDVLMKIESEMDAIEQLTQTARAWTETEYHQTNERLYTILADCYSVWRTLEKLRKARTRITELMKERQLQARESTSLATMIVRLVFNADCNRINAYANVLKIARSENVEVDALPVWIKDRNGVEEVRRLGQSSKQSMGNRYDAAAALLAEAPTLKEITGSFHGIENCDVDEYVVLVARPTPNGYAIVRGTAKANIVKSVVGSFYSDLKASKTVQNDVAQTVRLNEQLQQAIANDDEGILKMVQPSTHRRLLSTGNASHGGL